MYTTRRPLLIADVSTFDGWFNVEAHRWIRAFVGMPICIADEVVGFLTLDSTRLGGFTAEHLNRLEVFANQASIAIRNARLYADLANEAAELDRRVVRRTVELDHQRSQLQAILDAMDDGVFYAEGTMIVYTNPALSHITGYRPDEIVGKPITLFRVPNHPENDHKLFDLNAKLQTERIWRDEMLMYGKQHIPIEIGLTVSLLTPPGEQPLRAVGVVRDIRKEKALQAQKRQFVANASHELRTPITNMKTRLYLIRRQLDRADEHLSVMEDVVEDMQALTEDLLDLARIENHKVTLTLVPIVLQDVIEQMVSVHQAAWELKRVHLVLDLPQEPITVHADDRRLTQVITNLVTNAFNYTSENGQVTVQIHQDGEWGVLMVSDTGVGIAPEHLSHVFEPFFRVDETTNGTGLGLSITREIVLLHGGEIRVESEPQRGSRFTVQIPLVKSPAPLPQ
jgi:two-component system phosphate regulon sensor histidine kinase PhoR